MRSMSIRTDTDDPTPMQACLNTWHDFLTGDRDALDRVLADDAALDALQGTE